MGTIVVYPKSAAEAAEIRAFLLARHIRLEELEPEDFAEQMYPCETDDEIRQSLREAVAEYHAMQRGDIPRGKDLREILKEMQAEQLAEKLAVA